MGMPVPGSWVAQGCCTCYACTHQADALTNTTRVSVEGFLHWSHMAAPCCWLPRGLRAPLQQRTAHRLVIYTPATEAQASSCSNGQLG